MLRRACDPLFHEASQRHRRRRTRPQPRTLFDCTRATAAMQNTWDQLCGARTRACRVATHRDARYSTRLVSSAVGRSETVGDLPHAHTETAEECSTAVRKRRLLGRRNRRAKPPAPPYSTLITRSAFTFSSACFDPF